MQPGDEIEFRFIDEDGEPRWLPGYVRAVKYEITTDTPGEWFCYPAEDVRSAPRLPL